MSITPTLGNPETISTTGEHSRSSEEGIKMSACGQRWHAGRFRAYDPCVSSRIAPKWRDSVAAARNEQQLRAPSQYTTCKVRDCAGKTRPPGSRLTILFPCWTMVGSAKHRLRSRSRLHDPIRYHRRRRIFEREYGVYGDGVCGVSARTASVGRCGHGSSGTPTPTGCPWGWRLPVGGQRTASPSVFR